MNYKSISDLNAVTLASISKLPRSIDIVVGIPRSGLLLANLISLHLNLPLADIYGFSRGQILGGGRRSIIDSSGEAANNFRHALVVDDSVFKGREMYKARETLAKIGFNCKITYASAFVAPEAKDEVDIAFELLPMPRIFEWNILNHANLQNACMEIDGVICVPPTNSELSNEYNYKNFLMQTPLLWNVQKPLGWLVTSRLEKYRNETESWLKQHEIDYKGLIMLQLPSDNFFNNITFNTFYKINAMRAVKSQWFVECQLNQAQKISNYSRMPAFSMAGRRLCFPARYINNPCLFISKLSQKILRNKNMHYCNFKNQIR